jgi:hypothetical protein
VSFLKILTIINIIRISSKIESLAETYGSLTHTEFDNFLIELQNISKSKLKSHWLALDFSLDYVPNLILFSFFLQRTFPKI